MVDPAPSSVPSLRVIAAADGGLAAVIDGAQLAVIDLESGTQLTRLALPHADAEVAWLGAPPRLLVFEREARVQTARLYDPETWQPCAEARVEASMRLLAINGPHALLVGARAAAVLQVSGASVRQSQFATRTLPYAAGAAGRQFITAHPGVLEEWDPEQRVPRRRLRVPQSTIAALGGSDRVVWFVTADAPARIEVIAVVNRGQPAAHVLPEPAASVVGHPRRDTVVCIGRDTGRVFVVDLDGRAPVRPLDGVDRVDAVELFVGRGLGMIALRAGAYALLGLDGRPLEATGPAPAPVVPASLTSAPLPAPVPAPEPPPPSPVVVEAVEPIRSPAPPPPPPRVVDDSAYPPVPAAAPRAAPRRATTLAGLAPRATGPRCPAAEYQTLLEHQRRWIIATAAHAIARDWDSGRLTFPRQDGPAYEWEVLALAGKRSGFAPALTGEARELLERADHELRAARATLGGRTTPIDRLRIEHDLDPTEELVLGFIAAPAVWGEIARLYGILANDPSRAACDEQLLWQLLGDTVARRDLARALDAGGALLARGLVRAAGDRARPFQPLAADPIVVKLLAGADLEHDVEPGVERVPLRVPIDGVIAPRPVIDRALTELAAAPPGAARVVVRGRAGSGRRTLLAAIAELAGRPLACVDAGALIRERRLNALPIILQRVALRGWLPCVDGLDTIPSDDPAARTAARAILQDYRGPVALRMAPHAQPPLEPGYVVIDLPNPTLAERADRWQSTLAQRGLVARDPDSLAARYTIGHGTIERVVEAVARTATDDVDRAIDDAMRQHLDTKLGAVATRITKLASWSQIVLPTDIRDSIVELIARVRHRRRVYDTWGFDQVMTSSRGLTALFQGGPGTGKTLVAGAIAHELGLELYRVDLSRVTSKWIGETEQNLAKVFDGAEEGQVLVLFDEADSLFTKRTEVRTSVDRYANLEVNYLLQRLDTFEGVAILTTNFGTAIDPAFKRRLSVRLTFPFPDEEARERLWRVHLPAQAPRAGTLDLAGLARRYRMSGGYIRNAALRAAFLAAEENSPLTQDHLERAVRAEFREVGKLAESGVLE